MQYIYESVQHIISVKCYYCYWFLCSVIECQWLREGPKQVFQEQPEYAWMEDQEKVRRSQNMQCFECHALCQAM